MDAKNEFLVLSYFLPQFHEIAENNEWWGEGFTEWTSLRKAKPCFGWQVHRRPIDPLGEYNLLEAETLQRQGTLANENGIDAFLVWDYWFGESRQLLQKPMELVLQSGIPFPFCFAWANHSWYDKSRNRLLIAQKYLGKSDYLKYFNKCLPYFKLSNYLSVEGCPVLGIFRPQDVPDLPVWVGTLRDAARAAGFPGIFLIAENTPPTASWARFFDKTVDSNSLYEARKLKAPLAYIREQILKRFGATNLGPILYDYSILCGQNMALTSHYRSHSPTVIAGWDTTPRHGNRGTIYYNFTTRKFRQALDRGFEAANQQSAPKLVVVKSWNEWAEGNVVEPDSIFREEILHAIKDSRMLAEESSQKSK